MDWQILALLIVLSPIGWILWTVIRIAIEVWRVLKDEAKKVEEEYESWKTKQK